MTHSEVLNWHARPSQGSVRRLHHRFGRMALYLVVLLLGIVFAFPFFYTVSSSLKQIHELVAFPPVLWPEKMQFVNYGRVWGEVPFGRWMLNTLRVVILSTTGAVASASLVAYSFARFKYRGRDVLFLLTLGTMMLPDEVTLIPKFVLFHRAGWLDTIKPLWVPVWFGGGGYAIFLMRQFLLTLPRELDEAALIDGASRFTIFTRILLPLCKPALATLAVITFLRVWNDFMGPLIYLNSPNSFTLSIGLNYFKTVDPSEGIKQHLLMAACVMNIAPCIVLFFVAQRVFVQGIATTGLKG